MKIATCHKNGTLKIYDIWKNEFKCERMRNRVVNV